VYPGIVDTKTYVYDPASLDILSLDIPTGSITVHTCPYAKNVTVKVSSGAKTHDLLQEIVLDVKETPNSLAISAKSPSFDLQHCQIMHVSVVIPASSQHLLSLFAKANVGYINVKTKSYTFNKLSLDVMVGVIKARKVSANDISAVTSFGGVMGCTWNATNSITVRSDIGGVCLKDIHAKQSSVSIDKGILRVKNVESPVWNSTLNYGCMVQKNVESQTLNSAINYGRMWISPSAQFSGHVVLSSPNAHFDVSARRGLDVPVVVVDNTPGAQQKWVKVDKDGHDGLGRFNLKSSSGSVYLFINSA